MTRRKTGIERSIAFALGSLSKLLDGLSNLGFSLFGEIVDEVRTNQANLGLTAAL